MFSVCIYTHTHQHAAEHAEQVLRLMCFSNNLISIYNVMSHQDFVEVEASVFLI